MKTWRDMDQAARACEALCAPLRWGRMWQDGAPTDEAERCLQLKRLRTAEKTLVRTAWAIWNSRGEVGLSELLELDPLDLRAVGLLLTAIATSPEAIDAWIDQQRARIALEDEVRRNRRSGT